MTWHSILRAVSPCPCSILLRQHIAVLYHLAVGEKQEVPQSYGGKYFRVSRPDIIGLTDAAVADAVNRLTAEQPSSHWTCTLCAADVANVTFQSKEGFRCSLDPEP